MKLEKIWGDNLLSKQNEMKKLESHDRRQPKVETLPTLVIEQVRVVEEYEITHVNRGILNSEPTLDHHIELIKIDMIY